MTELPSHLEYQLGLPADKRNLDLYDFTYDQSELSFNIGESIMKIADFDPYTFITGLDVSEDMAIDLKTVADHYLVIPPMSGLITGPKLHNWVWENPEAYKSIPAIMHAAYTSLVPNPEEIPFDLDADSGFMGFAAGNTEFEGKHTGIHLQVAGNCACFGPSQDGLFIHDGMEHGFAQYELHNADTQAQRASLYAGMGHLAKLASETRFNI